MAGIKAGQTVSEYDQHNHTLQTNTWHREEEHHIINRNKTQVSELKQSYQLSLPCQDDCKTRADTK